VDQQSQTSAFADDLDCLIERYRQEFDVTYASVVGVLFMKAHLLCQEAENENPPENKHHA